MSDETSVCVTETTRDREPERGRRVVQKDAPAYPPLERVRKASRRTDNERRFTHALFSLFP